MSLKLYYQYCVVNYCASNSKRTPNKLFIPVPRNPEIRQKWFTLASQDWTEYSENTCLYFCEDHFDLPNDMDNYIQFKVQGHIKKIRMREGCVPSKFDCQPGRKRPAPIDCAVAIKKARKDLIDHILKEDEARCTVSDSLQVNKVLQAPESSQQMSVERESHTKTKVEHKSVQVYIGKKFRSKKTQTTSRHSEIATSPLKTHSKNVSVSTFDTQFPSTSGTIKKKHVLWLENEQTSESEVSMYTPSVKQESSSSPCGKKNTPLSDSSLNQEFVKIDSDIFKREALKHTLDTIKRKPRYYIGIPERCYFLVNIIVQQHNIPEEHVLLCLKKIRLNTKFSELGDQFGMSLNYASKIFCKNVPILAKALKEFIVKLDDSTEKALRLNLPIAFRHKYSNVSCIVDCLETEIQKPSKALHQALTWSEYKKANTVKYLISCTPDGLINYISPGYGGRISDVLLVENCDFLDTLKPGACILADRGFKHMEQLLLQRSFKLLRPPSVPSGTKLSKKEVRQTKQIASVRIHIERVIRRVREFAMFKPHSVINTNLLGADEAIKICCALINLQDSIIK